MKRLATLLLFSILGLCAFGQETFKNYVITNVDVRQNKVYFSKMNISRTIPCVKPGAICKIVPDTTFTAEVFGMTDAFSKQAHELKDIDYIELYQKGFAYGYTDFVNSNNTITRREKSSTEKLYFSGEVIERTEPEANIAFLLSTVYKRKSLPVIDKKTGMFDVKPTYIGELFPSFAMYGFILWFLSILFALSDFRRYKSDGSHNKKAYNDGTSDDIIATSFLCIISTACFVVEIITHNQQLSTWSLSVVIGALLLNVVFGVLRSAKKFRFKFLFARNHLYF